MSLGIRRPATAAAAFLLACGGLTTLAATPASAVDFNCKYQSKTFPTPGDDTFVEIELCVQRVADGYEASADVNWFNGGDSSVDDHRKFDRFDVQVRVEQRVNGSDVVKGSRTCDMRFSINTSKRGGKFCTKFVTHDRTAKWSADGKVVYDLDRDGKGSYTWNLTGSPLID
ncbi:MULTISPECIES: hypothetical protein [unclassified Streptomyces]|uniref:hypothetical protein n=1 Tax=unclassified Streptomyces TaxID=2593676 RepID=UPI003D755F2F